MNPAKDVPLILRKTTNFRLGRQSLFWIELVACISLAAAVRLILFRGMFASDDLVYFDRAMEIANGSWPSSEYIGALRYGVNIPIAAAIWIFGPSLASASLVPLLCSLGEILVVALLVRASCGERPALYSALLLCFLPLHIQLATSIHADPILAFAITSTFALFWQAETRQNRSLYFAAGLAAGYVYWVKEAAVLFLLTFGLYVIVRRRWSWLWLYCAGGAVLAFFLNCSLMWALSGNPFHDLQVMRGTVDTGWTSPKTIDWPLYYFVELYVKIGHTWLIGYLALIGVVQFIFQRQVTDSYSRKFEIFVLVWIVGLIAAFSFVPVSISPLRFVMKQSNYMTIFLAPLAILGGLALSKVKRPLQTLLLGLYVVGGFILAALAQQDLRAFVGNGQAAEAYAASHPQEAVFGTGWLVRISTFHAHLHSIRAQPHIHDLRELHNLPRTHPDEKAFVVIDRQTLGRAPEDFNLTTIPSCWKLIGTLPPAGYGFGSEVAGVLISFLRAMPQNFGAPVAQHLTYALYPPPAELYEVPNAQPWCGKTQGS